MKAVTIPQQRTLARFRRGAIRWNGTGWRAHDLYHVSHSTMQRLKALKLIRYQYGARSRAVATLTKTGEALLKDIPVFCRACGCTDERACEGGCSWVLPDLCSACVGKRGPL